MLLSSCLLIPALGCAREGDPVAAFEEFHQAVRQRKREVVLERLSSATQEVIRRDITEHEFPQDSTEGGKGRGGNMIDALDLHTTRALKKVTLVSREDGRAVLKVVDILDRGEEVVMVREEGRWRVDLRPR